MPEPDVTNTTTDLSAGTARVDNLGFNRAGQQVQYNEDGSVANDDRADALYQATAIEDEQLNALETAISDYNYGQQITQTTNEFIPKFKITSLAGIEGLPYQFLPSVDRRVDLSNPENTINDNLKSSNGYLGRKYAEKIVTQMPLLFLAPCNPKFATDNFTDSDRSVLANALLGSVSNIDELLSGSGRFYSSQYAYAQYYNYLNVMLTCVAHFLGIEHEKIYLGGEWVEIGDADWSNEATAEFTNTYLSKQNLVFYMDSIDTISESFANSTMQSQVAGLINGFSDTAKEISYLFGNDSGITNLAETVVGAGGSVLDAINGIFNLKETGGAILGTVASQNGLDTILGGGKIIFPEMWSDSSYEKSYSIGMKLRSPDNDSLSIFLNVLKPYCKILCMTLPHMIDDNVNAYKSPFICKAYCKGLFNIDLGMITGLSANKGATCCWNDDGLPTQIDLDIEIKDLYSQLSMTAYEDDSLTNLGLLRGTFKSLWNTPKQLYNIVNNTAYMDFLANMAGLNINEMEWTRKALMYYDLAKNRVSNFLGETIGNRFTQDITSIMARVYDFL